MQRRLYLRMIVQQRLMSVLPSILAFVSLRQRKGIYVSCFYVLYVEPSIRQPAAATSVCTRQDAVILATDGQLSTWVWSECRLALFDNL